MRLSNLLSACSLLSPKGASKMLRATGHARMVINALTHFQAPGIARQGHCHAAPDFSLSMSCFSSIFCFKTKPCDVNNTANDRAVSVA